jgi:hypothetical protein
MDATSSGTAKLEPEEIDGRLKVQPLIMTKLQKIDIPKRPPVPYAELSIRDPRNKLYYSVSEATNKVSNITFKQSNEEAK